MDAFLIGGTSEIRIGEGLAVAPGVLPDRADRRRVGILAQPTVESLAGAIAAPLEGQGLGVGIRILPDGEAAKNLAEVEATCLWLNELRAGRADTVLGVGGGALTDVAGFVAATYLRGVEAVYVPTTLLGAVDAAIGGKTAVNVGGKNLVGAFRHPSRVVIDTDVLAALPTTLRRDGAAEAIKAGLIGDPDLVTLYEKHGIDAPLNPVVRRAIAVKAAIVDEDFTEAGRRAVLNFGHTIGHAIEHVSGMNHAHAVAIGMVAAAAASERAAGFGDAARVRRVIASTGLPVEIRDAAPAAVRRALLLDKKRGPDALRMVLLRRVGEAIVTDVDAATVDAALAAVGIE